MPQKNNKQHRQHQLQPLNPAQVEEVQPSLRPAAQAVSLQTRELYVSSLRALYDHACLENYIDVAAWRNLAQQASQAHIADIRVIASAVIHASLTNDISRLGELERQIISIEQTDVSPQTPYYNNPYSLLSPKTPVKSQESPSPFTPGNEW